ncbi:hypothetical protein HW115_03010 [Verrucomicrobiaceae bacterium N1E253]|uniref:Uncharacterized protein n=1 Tax=Oceaniferula marina TaxID=2748318 RepID=A0A851GH40_9BACT|nr:hypothetical protein [Oceaniferula marina]NWK54565.1 hypothetical protein [Oceaniferula marina]
MANDPYQPPSTPPLASATQPQEVPLLVIQHLHGTRPWVRFCSLAGYVAAVFLLLIGALTIHRMLNISPLSHLILLAGFFIILALLFAIPCYYLSRYEKSITHLHVSHQLEDLEQALADQRAFWRQMAIMILIILIIYLITIALSAILLLARQS